MTTQDLRAHSLTFFTGLGAILIVVLSVMALVKLGNYWFPGHYVPPAPTQCPAGSSVASRQTVNLGQYDTNGDGIASRGQGIVIICSDGKVLKAQR